MKWLRPSCQISQAELNDLEAAMKRYYATPPRGYHEEALQSSSDWTQPDLFFHNRIVSFSAPHWNVLDVGCGPANACSHFSRRGAQYTGVDLAEAQLIANKKRYPAANFVCLHWRDLPSLRAKFDLVTSFFTLEHVVNPRKFIEASASRVRPGGLWAILCPNYLERGFLPSQHFFGREAGGIKAKLKQSMWLEAAIEIVDRYVCYPFLIHRARNMARHGGAWVINLRPVCLEVQSWALDWDAVYMVSEDEVADYVSSLGFTIVERGVNFRSSRGEEKIPDFCYVVGKNCG